MLSLKAPNPIETYQGIKKEERTAQHGDKVDDLPNKDWLRAT